MKAIILAGIFAYFILATAFFMTYNSADVDLRIRNFLDHGEPLTDFTAAEQSHMQDVKKVWDWVGILYILSIATLLFMLYKDDLGKAMRYGSGATLGVIVVIAAAAVLNFNSLWNGFHTVFFPQGNWMFPADSLLITLFPLEFFQGFAVTFFIAAAILSLLPWLPVKAG